MTVTNDYGYRIDVVQMTVQEAKIAIEVNKVYRNRVIAELSYLNRLDDEFNEQIEKLKKKPDGKK